MELYLLRHAQSIANEKSILDGQRNSPLSKRGIKESKILVKKLRKYKFDIIILSTLKRTRQTIKPYLSSLKNPKVIVKDITKERNLGVFAGKKVGFIRKYCIKHNLDKASFRPKKGESIMDVCKRAEKFLKYLRSNFKNKQILICGHQGFLQCLQLAILKKQPKNFFTMKQFKNCEMRRFDS